MSRTVRPGERAEALACRAGRVHRGRLAPEDLTVIGVIPCTRPARILVDSAVLIGYDPLCELVDDVLCRPLARPPDVRAAIERAGRDLLRGLLATEVLASGG